MCYLFTGMKINIYTDMFAYSICYNLITYNIHRHKVSAWAWVPPAALVVPSCPRPRLFPPYQDIKTVKSNYKHMSVFHGCMSRPRTKLRSKLKSDFRVWPCHAMICNAYHLECSVCTSKGLLHYRRHSLRSTSSTNASIPPTLDVKQCQAFIGTAPHLCEMY